MKGWKWISWILGVLGAVLILVASVPFDELTKNLSSYIAPLGLDRRFLLLSDEAVSSITLKFGVASSVSALIVYLVLFAIKRKRLKRSGAIEVTDYWAERKRLEISVLANVSAGREPTDVPIDKDPENSRFRELKDAIDTGELESDLHGNSANFMSTVTMDEFTKYVAATNKFHWIEVLHRWQAIQSPSEKELTDELKEKRIPLLKFLEIARRRDWIVLDAGGYEAFDLIHGITEAASLGDIVLLGKKMDRQMPNLTFTGRRQVIPAELWQTHVIEPTSCLIFTNPGIVVGLIDDNRKTHTKCDQGNPLAFQDYADLYMETDGLLGWLDNDANDYRGHTQRTYGD